MAVKNMKRIKHSTFVPLAVLLFIGVVILTGISTMRGYWWISAVAALILCMLMFSLIAVTDFAR